MASRQRSPRVSLSDEGPRYAPPEDVHQVVLSALLGGVRDIRPEQQTRLGFDGQADLMLWCAGDTHLVRQRAVAIVGTREVSAEGAARARRLARELVHAGIVVVSGLARGVDTEALTAAIEAGGRVIAVIGTPIDKAYPAENRRLQEQIYREHLLISQFAPGIRTFQSHFPERNKLMAAATDASVIIEAGDTSGTLHQAAECVRLGRWLFLAKNVVENPSLKWPTRFTGQQNVRTLSDTADILAVLPDRS